MRYSPRLYLRGVRFIVLGTNPAEVVGLYILHPNNIGRCGHICNASYAVDSKSRGKHIGEMLVTDCLKKAKDLGFRVLQFNAVKDDYVYYI